MTERQRQIYDYIVQYQKKHGDVPKMIQLAKRFKCTHQNIDLILKALVKNGYLRKKKQIVLGSYEIVDN